MSRRGRRGRGGQTEERLCATEGCGKRAKAGSMYCLGHAQSAQPQPDPVRQMPGTGLRPQAIPSAKDHTRAGPTWMEWAPPIICNCPILSWVVLYM